MMLTVFILLAAGISADAAGGRPAPALSAVRPMCRPYGCRYRAYFICQTRRRRSAHGQHDQDHDLHPGTETGDPDDAVTFSENAARQPEVKLGAKEGETFLLKDLLYSLMLESHNDSAVAGCETIAGSTEAFADLMNGEGSRDWLYIHVLYHAERAGCLG